MATDLLNESWSNSSLMTTGDENRTINGSLPTNQPGSSTIDWLDEKKAMYTAEIVLQCTFLVVGLFGNFLTIAIMVYTKWTNVATRHVLTALAISDSAMIITQIFNQDFFHDMLGLDVRALSNIGCKICFMFYRTSKLTSSWLVVYICFERYIAVMYPLKVRKILTEKRTNIFILANYVTMTIFNIILAHSTAVKNDECQKYISTSSNISISRALLLCELLLYSVIPIMVMSVLTPVIIIKLVHRHKAQKRLVNNIEDKTERGRKQLQELIRTTVALTSVVVTFIILLTPIAVFHQVKFWQEKEKHEIESIFYAFMLREISQRLEQVNYSINFFLYILNSSRFRNSVLELMHLKVKKTFTSTYPKITGTTRVEEQNTKQVCKKAMSSIEVTGNTEVPDCTVEPGRY